jgi:ATP-dependent DNA ligase
MRLKRFKYFYPEKPVLVHRDQELVNRMSENPDYVGEIKFNGIRLVLHVIDGKPQFWGRHGEILTYKPSDTVLGEIREKIPTEGYYIFDGELRHNKVPGVRDKIVLWDVLAWAGRTTRSAYTVRRELLKSLNLDTSLDSTLILIEQCEGNFKETFDRLITESDEFEGIVMKNLKGKLNLGRTGAKNSQWMFKIRRTTGRHRY